MLKTFVIVFLLALVAGCGKDKKKSTSSISEVMYGTCTSALIQDNNRMALKCEYVSTQSQKDSCVAAVQYMIDKYPTVDCETFEKGTEFSVHVTRYYYEDLLAKAQSKAVP